MTSKVGDAISAANARWTFGGDVPRTFDQHIRRSIPRYSDGHEIVVALADFFLRRGSVAYELGCSTGELIRRIAEETGDRGVSLIGLEIEAAMVAAARERTAHLPSVEIRLVDIAAAELDPSDLIVSYYTIQFYSAGDPPADLRQDLR